MLHLQGFTGSIFLKKEKCLCSSAVRVLQEVHLGYVWTAQPMSILACLESQSSDTDHRCDTDPPPTPSYPWTWGHRGVREGSAVLGLSPSLIWGPAEQIHYWTISLSPLELLGIFQANNNLEFSLWLWSQTRRHRKETFNSRPVYLF